MIAGSIVVGLSAIWIGFLAYSGRWQSWAHRTGYVHCAGFAALYFGGALVSIGVLMAIPRNVVAPELLMFTGMPLLWCSIIGFWWMPSFMLPKWFLNGRNERRQAESAIREMKRTAKQSKKARRRQ